MITGRLRVKMPLFHVLVGLISFFSFFFILFGGFKLIDYFCRRINKILSHKYDN